MRSVQPESTVQPFGLDAFLDIQLVYPITYSLIIHAYILARKFLELLNINRMFCLLLATRFVTARFDSWRVLPLDRVVSNTQSRCIIVGCAGLYHVGSTCQRYCFPHFLVSFRLRLPHGTARRLPIPRHGHWRFLGFGEVSSFGFLDLIVLFVVRVHSRLSEWFGCGGFCSFVLNL